MTGLCCEAARACSTGAVGSLSPPVLAGTSRSLPPPSIAQPWYGQTTHVLDSRGAAPAPLQPSPAPSLPLLLRSPQRPEERGASTVFSCE